MRSLWTWSSRLPHRSHLTSIDPPCPFESQTDGDHPFNTPRRPFIHGLPDPQHRLRSPRPPKPVKNISSRRGIGVLNANQVVFAVVALKRGACGRSVAHNTYSPPLVQDTLNCGKMLHSPTTGLPGYPAPGTFPKYTCRVPSVTPPSPTADLGRSSASV